MKSEGGHATVPVDLRLYGLLDVGVCGGDAEHLARMAAEAAAGGCTLLQYREKTIANARETVARLRRIHAALQGTGVPLLMNDRSTWRWPPALRACISARRICTRPMRGASCPAARSSGSPSRTPPRPTNSIACRWITPASAASFPPPARTTRIRRSGSTGSTASSSGPPRPWRQPAGRGDRGDRPQQRRGDDRGGGGRDRADLGPVRHRPRRRGAGARPARRDRRGARRQRFGMIGCRTIGGQA